MLLLFGLTYHSQQYPIKVQIHELKNKHTIKSAPKFASDIVEPVVLSTAPWDEKTHWKQTAILLPISIPVEEGDADT